MTDNTHLTMYKTEHLSFITIPEAEKRAYRGRWLHMEGAEYAKEHWPYDTERTVEVNISTKRTKNGEVAGSSRLTIDIHR